MTVQAKHNREEFDLVALKFDQLPETFRRILDQTTRYFNEHGEHPAQLKGITREGDMISVPVHEEIAVPILGMHLVDSKALNLARLKVEPIVFVCQGVHEKHPQEDQYLPANTKMVEGRGAMYEAITATYHDPTGTLGAVAPILEHEPGDPIKLGPWCCAGYEQAEWHDGPMRNLYSRSDQYSKFLEQFGIKIE